MSEHDRHPDDVVPTQPDDDDRDPLEYLRVVVEKQILPSTDLDADEPAGRDAEQSRLYLAEAYSGDGEPRRVRLRLEHPDSTVSDVGALHTLREMDAFLRGLSEGERGTIDAKADHVGDGEGDA